MHTCKRAGKCIIRHPCALRLWERVRARSALHISADPNGQMCYFDARYAAPNHPSSRKKNKHTHVRRTLTKFLLDYAGRALASEKHVTCMTSVCVRARRTWAKANLCEALKRNTLYEQRSVNEMPVCV